MMRRSIVAALISVWASASWAACPTPLQLKDGNGTLQNFGVTLDGSSNCYGNVALVDGATAANKATVNASGALLTAQTGALPTGANVIGKVGIDQTTPGTTNLVQVFNFPTGLTQTGNALDVNIKSSVAPLLVGGTVAVTGVSTAANQTIIQGVVGAGTAPTTMNMAGGQYRATPLALSDLQSAALQLGPSGGLIVDATSLTIAQGSSTGSQRGSLMMAAVTTGSPSYTSAQTSSLSLTTSGGLRIDNSTVAGTAIDTNTGTASAGTQRFVLATNQPSLTTPLNVRLTDGTNNSTVKASGAAAATTDTSVVVGISPNPGVTCSSKLAINQTNSTDVLTSTNKVYICSLDLVVAGAEQVSIVEGTGSTCGTGTNALWGGATADATHGMPFAAGGVLSKTSYRPFAVTQTTADHICILKSGSTLLSGSMWYVDHT